MPFAIGATPLPVALANLAMYSTIPERKLKLITNLFGPIQNRISGQSRGNVEIAIQLIKLGANCDAVLRLGGAMPLHQRLGLDNKSAYQLIQLIDQPELSRVA
jgi:hypothetical protein